MTHPYAISVPIPAVSDNGQFMVSQLYSSSHRENPAVNPFETIYINILGRFARASYSRNDTGIMPFQTRLRDGGFDRSQYPEIPASGTPLDFGFSF
jgi:hypothetical protein